MAEAFMELKSDCPATDIELCNRAFKQGGVEAVREYIQKKREEWKTMPLNIAVIGNSGVGKSSFINAIRGLTADDDGAAEVDVVECTSDIKAYPHPENELMEFWDLPGVGSTNFPKDSYLGKIKVNYYDFFLLLSATRFTENDMWLGQEIIKLGKMFFFVRTKVGIDVNNDRMAHPKSHNKHEVLARIRMNTIDHLTAIELEHPKIFLIDSYNTEKFDFHKLELNLIHDFPEMKRSALILSMRATSEEMIKLKAKELRRQIWLTALESAFIGFIPVPVPGVSLVYDALLAVREGFYYYRQLGLTDESLRRHAQITKTDPKKLMSIVDEAFGPEFFTAQGIKIILQSAACAATIAVEELVRTIVPLVGSLLTAPLSFGGTYYILKLIIDKMESVALQVVKYAAENSEDEDGAASEVSHD